MLTEVLTEQMLTEVGRSDADRSGPVIRQRTDADRSGPVIRQRTDADRSGPVIRQRTDAEVGRSEAVGRC